MKIKKNIIKGINDDLFMFLILLVIFSIGIVIGAISIKIISQDHHDNIVKYLNFLFNNLDDANYTSFNILKQSLVDNFKMILIMIFTSFIIIGIPIILLSIIYKGFAIGFSVGFLVSQFKVKGFIFSIIGILPQNLFIILGLLFIGARCINFSMKKLKTKRLQKSHLAYYDLKDFIFIIFVYLLPLFIGGIFESFFSNYFLKLLL